MKKTVITASGLLVGFAILSVCWHSVPPAQPIGGAVVLAFAGYTNLAGTNFATFAVTNRTAVPVRRYVPCSIVSQEDSTSLTGAPIRRTVAPIVGPEVSLPPGGSEVIMILAPSNRAPWRAEIMFSRDGWRRRLFWVTWRTWCYRFLPDGIRDVPFQYAQSESVGQ